MEGDSSKQLLLVLKNVAGLHAPWISSGKLIYHMWYVDFYVSVNVEESQSREPLVAHWQSKGRLYSLAWANGVLEHQ